MEEIRKVGDNKKGPRKENNDENKDVKGGRRRVPTEGRAIWGICMVMVDVGGGCGTRFCSGGFFLGRRRGHCEEEMAHVIEKARGGLGFGEDVFFFLQVGRRKMEEVRTLANCRKFGGVRTLGIIHP